LLRRTFREDLEVCVDCGGSVQVLTFATEPDELEPLLLRHGEPLEPPPVHPARPPPQLELGPGAGRAREDCFDEPA